MSIQLAGLGRDDNGEEFDDPYSEYEQEQSRRSSLLGTPDPNEDAAVKRNKCLLITAFLTFSLFAVAEMIGGIAGNSLSLIEDAATMLVDAATYGFNYYAEVKKKGAPRRTVLKYEIVPPAFSVVALILTTGFITYLATDSLFPDEPCTRSPAGHGLCRLVVAGSVNPSVYSNDTVAPAWSDCEETCRSADDAQCRFWQWNASSSQCLLMRDAADNCGAAFADPALESGTCDEPPEGANILVMWIFSGTNLVLDFVNLYTFSLDARKKRAEIKASGRPDPESNANMLSAFTHIVIDTMRSLAVMVAAASASILGVDSGKADAVCALTVTAITMLSTLPLFKVLRSKLKDLARCKHEQPMMPNNVFDDVTVGDV